MNAVMVVEDEQLIAKDIADTLTVFGYDVTGTVSSGEACMKSATHRRPDLVLMDIRLQGELDGIDAARLLREWFDIPVVFLSAYADETTLERAKLTAPLGYLVKPFGKTELRSAIEMGLFRHQMERRLREREHWSSMTLRAIGEAVIAVDCRSQISFMNQAAEALLSRTEMAANGRPLTEVVRFLDERTREPLPELIQLCFDRRQAVGLTRSLLLSGDRELPVEGSVAPIFDQRGGRLGAVLALRDMTRERHARQQSADAERFAALGAAADGIARQLDHPLDYVLSRVALLGEELQVVRGLARAALAAGREQEMAEALDRLQELISEVGAGAKTVSCIVSDLGLSTLRRSGAVARVARPADPIQASPRSDGGRVGELFLSMMLNAADALQADAAAGEVAVVTELAPQPNGSSQVQFTIRGAGSRKMAELVDRLFAPSAATKPARSGLGLSVCQRVVEALGGSLQTSDEPGDGSSFSMRLPFASPSASLALASEVAPPHRRGRLLVVDDDKRILTLLSGMLAGSHDVVAAGCIREALDQLSCGCHFDVIVCGQMRAEMSAIDLHRILLARDPELASRMILLSGARVREDFLRVVPKQVLDTPLSLAELLLAIARQSARPSSGPST